MMIDVFGFTFSIDGCTGQESGRFEGMPSFYEDMDLENLIWTILVNDKIISITVLGKTVLELTNLASYGALCVRDWVGTNLDAVQFSMGDDTGSRFFRPLEDSSMCPASYPYVFLMGTKCCAVGKEGNSNNTSFGELCDGGDISWESVCCEDNRNITCPNPPCIANIFLRDMKGDPLNCLDVEGDPAGIQYRGHADISENGAPCLPWSDDKFLPLDERGYLHNYCRNNGSEDRPWCYIAHTTDDFDLIGYCGIPKCINGLSPRDVSTMDIDGVVLSNYFKPHVLLAPNPQRIRLHHPVMSSRYVLGYHDAGDALDGNYDTFALTDRASSYFKAKFSESGREQYFIHNVTVHFHIFVHDNQLAYPNLEHGMVVVLNNKIRRDSFDFYCEDHLFKYATDHYYNFCTHTKKRAVTGLEIRNLITTEQKLPLAIREIEVYGDFYVNVITDEDVHFQTKKKASLSSSLRGLKVELDLEEMQIISLKAPFEQVNRLQWNQKMPSPPGWMSEIASKIASAWEGEEDTFYYDRLP